MSSQSRTSNPFSLGRVGDLLFVRQTPMLQAQTHSTLASRFAAWRANREAAKELATLSDRELADIGLTRSEIPSALKNRR